MHRRDKLFDPSQAPETLERIRASEPEARQDFVILFTARSGSSWLTEVCENTGFLSRPDECFNPEFMPEMTQVLGARNMDEYVEVLRRRRNTKGLFGCEATYGQICAVFDNADRFLQYFHNAHYFWLLRRDIVAQAISLAKMVTTGLGHSIQADVATIDRQDRLFSYDSRLIWRWLNHILAEERGTAALLQRFGLTPTAFSYEGMMARGAEAMANFLAVELGLPERAKPGLQSRHAPFATALNRDYAARFRREEVQGLQAVEAERATWLASCRF
jgi:LPS sulfotransferase NodH